MQNGNSDDLMGKNYIFDRILEKTQLGSYYVCIFDGRR